jgi:hypothetical protein
MNKLIVLVFSFIVIGTGYEVTRVMCAVAPTLKAYDASVAYEIKQTKLIRSIANK